MKYTLENGKLVNIPNKELDVLMNKLHLSKEDAIDTWLCDNDYEEDETVEELSQLAKDNKVTATIHEAQEKKTKKESKPRVKVVAEEKKQVFQCVLKALQSEFGENVNVFNENKLIFVQNGEKKIKIDFVDTKK